MRAAIYVRVSTEDQAQNYSIRTQIEACQKMAATLGFVVAEEDIFVDDGYSGTMLERPALTRLRALIEPGAIKAVVCHDPDRLSRKLVHLLLLTEEWEAKGVALHFVLHPVDASPEGKMFLQLKGIFAEYERVKFMERSRRGRKKRLEEGKIQASRPTYGYCYHAKKVEPTDPNVGRYTINDEQAQVVRQIFRWFLEDDLSTREIAKTLAARGVPSPSGMDKWHRHVVASILKNPTYCGVMYHNRRMGKVQATGSRGRQVLRPRDEWLPIKVPPIVPDEWLELAQAKLRQHVHRSRRNPENDYLLSGMGILWCKCGAAMNGRGRSRKNGKIYTWYDCNRRYPGFWPAEQCRVKDLPGHLADAIAWGEISKRLLEPDLLVDEIRKRMEGKEAEVARLRKDLEQVEEKLRGAEEERKDLAYMGRKRLFGPKTLDLVEVEAAKLDHEERTLQQQRFELNQRLKSWQLTDQDVGQITDYCTQIRDGLASLSLQEKRKLVAALTNKVIWDGATLRIELVIPLKQVAAKDEQG